MNTRKTSTLKRIEVNLCYEVGITLFARISRFLFAAETFSATLVAWGDLDWLKVGLSVILNRLSLDTYLLRDLTTSPDLMSLRRLRDPCVCFHTDRVVIASGILYHLVVPCCIDRLHV